MRAVGEGVMWVGVATCFLRCVPCLSRSVTLRQPRRLGESAPRPLVRQGFLAPRRFLMEDVFQPSQECGGRDGRSPSKGR